MTEYAPIFAGRNTPWLRFLESCFATKTKVILFEWTLC